MDKNIDLKLLRENKKDSFWADVWSENNDLFNKLEIINAKPVFTIKNKDELLLYQEFCTKVEYIKAKFLSSFIAVNELAPYDKDVVNTILEPLIPRCNFDTKNEVFTMRLNFVPYLHFSSVKEFSKVKNVILRLILEGINRMEVKPNFNKNAVLIVFTLSSPYSFDVDNIDFKYIIDAFRYSKFFYDDSYEYVSYMVEGKRNKTHPLIDVKIFKKDCVNMPK